MKKKNPLFNSDMPIRVDKAGKHEHDKGITQKLLEKYKPLRHLQIIEVQTEDVGEKEAA